MLRDYYILKNICVDKLWIGDYPPHECFVKMGYNVVLPPMTLNLLTYNLLYNKALIGIETIIDQYHPDILTLQEIKTSLDNLTGVEKYGYKLADYSHSFLKHQKIYGVATYYNPKTLSFTGSRSINLPRSIYEMLLFLLRRGNNPRTVLKTEFISRQEKKKFNIYNVHLTTWGTNKLRMKQIAETFQSFHLNTIPSIIAGDFNLPYGRKTLETFIKKNRLSEATNNLSYTFEKKLVRFIPIKLKLDYVLTDKLPIRNAQRLNYRFSDHYPIFVQFDL